MRHTLWIERACGKWSLQARCGNVTLQMGRFRWRWLAVLVGVCQIGGPLTAE